MIKLLFARVLPLGLTGMFLRSSVSPLKPALQAFAAANAALSGQSVGDSGADFGEVIDAAQQIGAEANGVAKAPAKKANAKDQLNDIIAQVKGRSVHEAPPSETAQAQAPKKGKGGKGKGAAKGGEGKAAEASADPTPDPGQAPEKAAPPGPEVKLTGLKGGKK